MHKLNLIFTVVVVRILQFLEFNGKVAILKINNRLRHRDWYKTSPCNVYIYLSSLCVSIIGLNINQRINSYIIAIYLYLNKLLSCYIVNFFRGNTFYLIKILLLSKNLPCDQV